MALRGRGQNNHRHAETKTVLSDDESLGLFSGNDSNNDRLLDNILRAHQPTTTTKPTTTSKPTTTTTGGGGGGGGTTSRSGYSKWNAVLTTVKGETLANTSIFSKINNGKTELPSITRSDAWMPAMALPSAYESPRRTKPLPSIRSPILPNIVDHVPPLPPSNVELKQPSTAANVTAANSAKDSNKSSSINQLPFDQVIIFPNSPINNSTTSPKPTGPTISRLRRQYRMGTRSVTDNGGPSISHPPLGSHVREGLDVNSILLSLGLHSEKTDSASYEKEGLLSKNRPDSRKKQNHHRPMQNGGGGNGGGIPCGGASGSKPTTLQVRSLFILCVLGAALYTLIQETAIVSEHSKALRKMALRRKRHFLRHEEGVDRPIVDQRVIDHLNKFRRPNSIEMMQVHGKVPVKHHGPEPLVDKPNYGDDAVKKEEHKSLTENLMEHPTDTKVGEHFANVLSSPLSSNQDHTNEEGGEQQPQDVGQEKQEPPSDALPPVQEEEVKTVAKAVEHILTETSDPRTTNDIPFLWIIPRAGSSIVKNIASQCLELRMASEAGGVQAEQKSLQVVDIAGSKFLNVNLATVPGIVEAIHLHLSESGLVDVVVSPRFPEASALFNPTHKGRAVALLRHPVERSISMFYHMQKHNVPVVAKLSIEEYAKSPHVENNWMTRMLSGRMTGEVGDFELGIAKKILQTKVVVGLLEQKEASMRRFEYYLGWNYTQDAMRQEACRKRILTGDYRSNEISSHRVKEGSQAWSLLLWQNKLDLKLYKYAKALFLQQGTELFSDMTES